MTKTFKAIGISLAGILALVLIFMTGFYSVQNEAVKLEEQVSEAKADINIQEKRRVDLVYNLVDTVKQYDSYEYKTLKDIVDARGSNKGNIGDVATMINAAAEAYPDLKSSANYKSLMNELSITENLIAEHRSNYNKQVKNYNRYIKKTPNSQILNFVGYEKANFNYLDFNAPEDAPQNLFSE